MIDPPIKIRECVCEVCGQRQFHVYLLYGESEESLPRGWYLLRFGLTFVSLLYCPYCNDARQSLEHLRHDNPCDP